MKVRKFFGSAAVVLAAMLMMVITLQPASAQSCIPQGATIESATLSVYQFTMGSATVTAHRVTDTWTETGVTWNSFMNSYDAAVEDSFITDGATGWRSVDVTSLVQDWARGVYPNYGILLKQDGTDVILYRSSEYSTVEFRPNLEICYSDSGVSECTTIKRPGVDPDGVVDTYITQLYPNINYGTSDTLVTLVVYFDSVTLEKQSLFWFDIETCPPEGPGTGTPGYWKNHPEAWPVDEITIGGMTYGKDTAIIYMMMPVAGDKTLTIFPALVAAKLNVLIGNDDSCVADMIAAADEWMATYGPVGSGIEARSGAWKMGESVYEQLDLYNNGDLCAPSRDSLEELAGD